MAVAPPRHPALGEVFLPFRRGRAQAPLVYETKSTVVVSALAALRARGLYDRYVAELTPGLRDQLLTLTTGSWIPVELMIEHYLAVQRLNLDGATVESIGGHVGERINRSVLAVALAASKSAGVTPWTALAVSHRMTDISWRGGDIAVYKLGPKDAIYEWVAQPCARVPYFVRSFCGLLRALASPFCAKAYVEVEQRYCTPSSVAYRLSWV